MARPGKQSLSRFASLLLIAAAIAAFLVGPTYLLSHWAISPARPFVCSTLASATPMSRIPLPRQGTVKPTTPEPHRTGRLRAAGVIAGATVFFVIWILASLVVMGCFSLGALLLPALAIGTCLGVAARYVAFFGTRFAWMGISAAVGIAMRPALLERSIESCRPLDVLAILVAGMMAGWVMRAILKTSGCIASPHKSVP